MDFTTLFSSEVKNVLEKLLALPMKYFFLNSYVNLSV